jgi:hypothetical protein
MVVQKFRQLFAQALVGLALVPQHDGAFEQRVLQVVRQLAPQIGGSCAEDQKIAGGNIVDDVIGLLIHGLTRCKIPLQEFDIGPSEKEKQRRLGREVRRLVLAERAGPMPGRTTAGGRIALRAGVNLYAVIPA